jgi:hypothetical protein
LIEISNRPYRRKRGVCLTPGSGHWGLGLRRRFRYQFADLVLNIRVNRTELVLNIQTMLLAQGQEILALHAQFTRQHEHPDLFLLRLQA